MPVSRRGKAEEHEPAPVSRRGKAEEHEPAPVSRRGRVCRQAAKAEPEPGSPCEAQALIDRFEFIFEQISTRLREGAYVAEHCSMLVEIARISAAGSCPDALRERAIEALLKLGRRPTDEIPCRRGLRELNDQCASRGIKQGSGT